MTTEINSAQAAQMSGGIFGANEEISQETREELDALGIAITPGMTETQAREKIEEVRFEDYDTEDDTTSQSVGNIELKSDIKNLASAIGISYQDTDTPDEIIIAISEELEAQIDEAENNPQALSTLMGYYRKLSSLDEQLDAVKSGQNKIFDAMDLLSANNRKEFGI
jgi:hypothetical protein